MTFLMSLKLKTNVKKEEKKDMLIFNYNQYFQ